MSHTVYAIEQLILRDFKVRYRNMSLGMFWSLLNPLVLMAVYTFVFTKIFRNTVIPHFPLYLLIGIVCYNYASLAWIAATYSITSNSGLVKRVNVPREVIPISALLANAIHFLVQLGLILLISVWVGVAPSIFWLWLPFLVILLILATSGISLLTSSLDVYFRDTRYIVESAALVLFWITPIVYSENMVPPEYRTWMLLNPLTGVIIAMREIILGRKNPDLTPLLYAAVATLGLLFVGIAVFEESKKRFADHL